MADLKGSICGIHTFSQHKSSGFLSSLSDAAAQLEQFCPSSTFTYNSPDKHGTAPVTHGGYSESIVVDEGLVLRVPANLYLAGVAPLLCAGITTYSPTEPVRRPAHPVLPGSGMES